MDRVVVVLDQSLSMPMTGLWYPARSAAHNLVDQLRAPNSPDHLEAVVGFGETARVADADRMAELQWDYTYGSNLAGALNLALNELGDTPGRVVVFTDLEPTAHYLPDGNPVFFYPPAPETIRETVKAIDRYRQGGIALEVRHYVPSELPHGGRPPPADRAIQQVAAAVLSAGGSLLEVPVDTPQPAPAQPEDQPDT
jgi:uncharacterized protein with von Willebrand factor type A (vWA) domain